MGQKKYMVQVVIHATFCVTGVQGLSDALPIAHDLENMTAYAGHYDDCPLLIDKVEVKEGAEVVS